MKVGTRISGVCVHKKFSGERIDVKGGVIDRVSLYNRPAHQYVVDHSPRVLKAGLCPDKDLHAVIISPVGNHESLCIAFLSVFREVRNGRGYKKTTALLLNESIFRHGQ